MQQECMLPIPYKIVIHLNHIKPCSQCDSEMHCFETSHPSQDNKLSFFIVSCQHCGHGPLHAFDLPEEAIEHWNNYS